MNKFNIIWEYSKSHLDKELLDLNERDKFFLGDVRASNSRMY